MADSGETPPAWIRLDLSAPRLRRRARQSGTWSIAGWAIPVESGRACRTTLYAGLNNWFLVANRYNLDLKRVIAAGHSAGGQLALWLAAQQAVDLRGVVPLAADFGFAARLRFAVG